MADFRKLFLVLAVIAITAVSASAQTSFSCAVSPAGPATLRSGGLTEEVGDALYTCTGGPVGTVNGSFTAQMLGTAAVSNRILADNAGSGFLLSNVALSVEVRALPGDAPTFYQVVQGLLQPSLPDTPATRNVIVFPNVTIPTGTGWDVKVRISGIRVVAPVVTSTQVGISVFEQISVSPSSAVPLTNPNQQVGQVYPALGFTVTNCNGTGSPSLTYQQCNSQFVDSNGDPNNVVVFGAKFSELQPGSFKIKQAVPGVGNQNAEFSGRIFGPSGLTPFITVSDVAGSKDTATRLILTITNIPAGVTVRVTDREIGGASTAGAMALNVPDASSLGAGGTPAAGSGSPASCSLLGSTILANDGVTPVNLVDANSSGSTAYAVWEVTASSSLNESLVFGVQISYVANPGAGSPALTGSTPAIPGGNFAPQSTIAWADKTSQIPRFQTEPITDNSIAIVPCVTNLLFPYVTSTSGYDTGIALVNTSLDNGTGSTTAPLPFDTSSQTGACTVYFFGNNTISPQTTPTVNPGSLVKFTMTNPPSTFTQATAGFEGYIIAQCAFQYAHGFAFIVDTRVPGFGSEGYLALVIPDNGGARPPLNFVANGGAGEQLVH